MKRVLFSLSLLSIIFIFGCATTPIVKINPEITKSNLPSRCCIEGVKPIEDDPLLPTGPDNARWMVPQMICSFYGSPITESIRKKAETRALKASLANVGVGIATIGAGAAAGVPPGVVTGSAGIMDDDSVNIALRLLNFHTHRFWDEDHLKFKKEINFFLAQGYPVIYTQREPVPHGFVLTGYDDSKKIFIGYDPSIKKVVEWSYENFNQSWAGIAGLIYPDELSYDYKGKNPSVIRNKGKHVLQND